MLLSHLIPRARPVEAESMATDINTASTIIAATSESAGTPATTLRPARICITPMPTEAATPKVTASTATRSAIQATGPTQRPLKTCRIGVLAR